MPYGDAKHNQIYRELVNVLGEDFVEDDPVVIEAFSRGELGNPYANKGRGEFIALPGGTEEVQQVIRLANRYAFPFSVTSTKPIDA